MKPKIKNSVSSNVFRLVLVLITCMIFYSLGFLVGRDGLMLGLTDSPIGVLNASKGKPTNVDFSTFWQSWDMVKKNYVGKIDEKKMVNGAISGMVQSVGDPYTTYLPADANSFFKEEMSGHFDGVGIEISMKDEKVVVVTPIDGSPAQKAGLEAQDVITAVDKKPTAGMMVDQVVKMIRGKSGTKVTLSILKKGVGDPKEFALTRGVIEIKSVKWEIKDGNIGYVKVTQFGEDTNKLFSQAINEFKNKNVKGIVVDMRNNPGGLLNVAEDMVSLLMKPGVVVKTKDKSGKIVEERTTQEPILLNPKMIVLVNEGSASASEIFAGAMQDSKRGTIVGVKTFGKGSVQDLTELPNGASIKVTIAKWLTPGGRQIDGKGIEPDIKVTNTDNKDDKTDAQLNKALEEVKK